MNVKQLDAKLNQALIDFSEEVRGMYEDGNKTPAAYGDISELARQTFYMVDTFRKEIVLYLNSVK